MATGLQKAGVKDSLTTPKAAPVVKWNERAGFCKISVSWLNVKNLQRYLIRPSIVAGARL